MSATPADPAGQAPQELIDDLDRSLRRIPGVVAVRISPGLVQVALDPGLEGAVTAEAILRTIRLTLPEPGTVEIALRPDAPSVVDPAPE